ncbi:MAG: helix-turn-helix domain-containing protein [Prevotella sp.]|nr:helix-turn-helix domain-containing protein [Bacteroides sp.]MCM1365776.1 helix-turn-helix domain-containing protein [Prevotella sp.]MCM1436532.1 helix-turn-helix domain-containing protein [Prevotella sp.]
MEENVVTRLKFFLESEGLSNSQFADTCGIPRPTLSQLLTGRNKKISDVIVGQIHSAYPQLSVMWLLFGEGPMHEVTHTDNHEYDDDIKLLCNDDTAAGEIYGENRNFTDGGTAEGCFRKENRVKSDKYSADISAFQRDSAVKKIAELEREIMKLKGKPRKVIQITVYYDDNTFETFRPSE